MLWILKYIFEIFSKNNINNFNRMYLIESSAVKKNRFIIL